MLKQIIIFSLLAATIQAHSSQHDFFKNEYIFLPKIENHPKKTMAAGILLTIIGLSLGQNNEYDTTWTQEGIAYGLIITGAILAKTGYTSFNK